MSHELSNFAVAPGARRSTRRLGRGIGSGRGKTCGRGVKGQKSRSGAKLGRGFEGGQMPMQRRLPKRGFTNIFAETYDIINLSDLNRLAGVDVVDIAILKRFGVVSGSRRVKVLGNGILEKALQVKANAFSASAAEKIQAAGGNAEVV